jgi:hypothetical protein
LFFTKICVEHETLFLVLIKFYELKLALKDFICQHVLAGGFYPVIKKSFGGQSEWLRKGSDG